MKILGVFLAIYSVVFAQESQDFAEKIFSQADTKDSYAINRSSCQIPKCCPYSYIDPLEKSYIYTEGEWLYWKIIAQIPFADVVTVRRRDEIVNNVAFPDDDKEKFNRFKLTSGYRIKLGIDLPYCGWNFYTQYQRINNSTEDNVTIDITRALFSNSAVDNDTKLIYPYWANALLAGSRYKWGRATSRQNIKYRILDGMLNKTFYLFDCFAFTPMVGFRGAWIKNELNVAYFGLTGSNLSVADVQDVVGLQNLFYGWGIKGSAQANWIIGWGFEIFGRTSLSGLVGDVIFRQTENFVDGNSAGTQTFFGSTHKETRWRKLLYNLEIATGINWGRRFCRNKFYFGLQFGYEFTLWPEFIRMNRYAYGDFPNTGFNSRFLGPVFAAFRNSLSLHGITLSGRVDF